LKLPDAAQVAKKLGVLKTSRLPKTLPVLKTSRVLNTSRLSNTTQLNTLQAPLAGFLRLHLQGYVKGGV